MADRPIGTIFVELDLDASRYTKGQQKLLKDAQSTTLNIEQNFKNLGIKSSAEMDLMRAKIINSFNAIANSSKATANDIIRAEEAKNAKLKALNDKQFGEQKSLLESLKSNWLAYAASIYAAGRAISQAMEMAKTGSMLEKQANAFVNLAVAAGTSSERILSSLKSVSGGMVAEADLMAAAGKAMLMSIPADKITELMKIAAATSRMTGQTITEAFNDITLGVARQSRMILDNLGILVDVDKANQDYAKSLGKTAESLTDVEKRQAFMTATLKAGNDMIARLGEKKGELEGINKLVAAQSDLWAEVNRSVAQLLDKELSAYARVLSWIDEKLKSMRSGAGEAARSDMLKEIEMLRSLESKGMAQPGTTMSKMAEFNRRWGSTSESEIANREAMQRYKAAEARKFYGSARVSDNEIPYDVEARWKAFEEGLKKAADKEKKLADEAKRSQEEVRKLHEQVAGLEDEFAASKVFSGEASQYERMQAQLRSGSEIANMEARRNKVLEDQRAAMAKADQELSEANWWKTYIEDTEDATRSNEIFTDSMNIMSQSAADAFAEFVTGTKSAKEAFTAMAQSMIAALTRLTTQRAFEEFASMLVGAGQSLFSGWAGGGSTPTGMGAGAASSWGAQTGDWGATMHSGGIVSGGGPGRMVPGMVFANAPRYHDGLAPEEVPAILKRGEGVFTPEQMKAMGSRSLSISVPVRIDSTGEQERDRRLSARMRDEVEDTARRVLREEMR